MRYDSMGIILTNRCGAACEHCCFSCSPQSTQSLPHNLVLSCIKESNKIPEITQYGFSGGESFLVFDQLVEYVEAAKKINRVATVMTNCQWAGSYEIAYERLKILKDAGLVGLGLSYDEFHQKFINKKNVSNVLQAAKALGLSTKVQGAVLLDSQIGNTMNALWPEIIDISFSAFNCYPVGRAKEKIRDDRYVRNTTPRKRYCRKASTFSIDVKGNVWPCCVPAVNETQLSVGNIYNVGIEQIYQNLKDNIFLKLLRNYGFDYFLEIAENNLQLDIPEKIISSCELCMYLFSEENFYRFLPYLRKGL